MLRAGRIRTVVKEATKKPRTTLRELKASVVHMGRMKHASNVPRFFFTKLLYAFFFIFIIYTLLYSGVPILTKIEFGSPS